MSQHLSTAYFYSSCSLINGLLCVARGLGRRREISSVSAALWIKNSPSVWLPCGSACWIPLPSSWQHLSSMFVWRIREDYQNCSVLYCVQQLYTMIGTHIWTVHKVDCWFRFSLALILLFVCFCHFVLVLFAFCCVMFSFCSTKPRDWLWRTSLKWPILCPMGRKTVTQ